MTEEHQSEARALEEKKRRITDAALESFLLYGYRRTSMEDIARACHLSRSALYIYFKNKEDVYRGMIGFLHEDTLAQASEASQEEKGYRRRLLGILQAKFVRHFALLARSEHAQELVDEHKGVVMDLHADFASSYKDLVQGVLESAIDEGELHLSKEFSSIDELVDLVMGCAGGLRPYTRKVSEVSVYEKRLEQWLDVLWRGLQGS